MTLRLHIILSHTIFPNIFSEISSRIFDLGAAVATPVETSSTRKLAYTEVNMIRNVTYDTLQISYPLLIKFTRVR